MNGFPQKPSQPVMRRLIILAGIMISVTIVFLIIYGMMDEDAATSSGDPAHIERSPEVVEQERAERLSEFDRATDDVDQFIVTTLQNLGIEGSSRTEHTETDSANGEKWLQIVRKAELKHFVPLEKANYEITERAREHDMELLDAFEVRNPKEHYVRIWLSRDDRWVYSVYLYPGKKSQQVQAPRYPQPTQSAAATTSRTTATTRPKLGIIIDDFGVAYSRLTREFIDIPYPLTLAILPHIESTYPAAAKIAQAAYNADKEVMLHLPMEPMTYPADNPGPGALFINDSPDVQKQVIERNLASLHPYVRGVNNHMGSRATAHEPTMDVLMQVLKQKGMYFVDSKTNRESIAARVAIRYGIGCRENWFYMDPEGVDVAYIESKLEEAADVARERGSIVVIGHISSKMLTALKRTMPKLERQGIEFVYVSQILH